MRKILSKSIITMVILMIAVSPLQGQDAKDEEFKAIQDAIKAKGLHWTPRKNPIFMLPRKEQKKLFGNLVEPLLEEKKFTKKEPLLLLNLPNSFDWRSFNGYNWMTPAKDQIDCGSCYAFATTVVFESLIKIKLI